MCVIAIKPKDVTIADKVLKAMFSANPDGAGIAYFHPALPKKIVVHKGLMTVNDVLDVLYDVMDYELVIHFRYATHGKTTMGQTHPFKVDPNIVAAKALSLELHDEVLFHNGVVSQYGNDTHSDTLDLVSSTLAHIPSLDARLKFLECTGSKYALMQDGDIYTVGRFEKYRGLYVSNTYFTGYIPMKKRAPVFSDFTSSKDACRLNGINWNNDILGTLAPITKSKKKK